MEEEKKSGANGQSHYYENTHCLWPYIFKDNNVAREITKVNADKK